MTGRGRPLRFLLLIIAGWIGGRTMLLWPRIDSVPSLIRAVVPMAEAAVRPGGKDARPPSRSDIPLRPPGLISTAAAETRPAAAPSSSHEVEIAADMPRTVLPSSSGPGVVPGLPPTPPAADHAPSRLSGSFWLLARGGSGFSNGVVGGQLGGSQAGLRLAYALDRRHRIAIAGRLTTPLGAGQREASIGVEWQPTRLPVRLVAEHRIAIGGGRGGPGAAIVGGAGPVPLAAGLRIDGYGQAGVIKRDVAEGYVDGAIHVARPLGRYAGVDFDLGASVWGAAQRGARRLDVGPSLGAVVRLAGQRVRLSLDCGIM